MKMFLISDNLSTLTGMRLAGVEGVVVHEREEIRQALDTAVQDEEIAIILITEKLGKQFSKLIDDIRVDHQRPLLVEIPDRYGTGRRPDFITAYVNEAIGVKL